MKSQLIALFCLSAISAAAVATVQWNGWTLYYGDAEAHLTIARRVVDSRTPGYDQIGTVWLPLPHVLMLPLVSYDPLWRSGLAGAVPSAICFVLGGMFLFASAQRIFGSIAAAAAALACVAMNPNFLYLQSIPMNEAVLFASLMALLYCTVEFRQTQSLGMVAGAGLASLSASMTRYEGWFIIPFVTLFFLVAARRGKLGAALLFGFIASAGPVYWLMHNWWYFGNALSFYNGPYSAKAIQSGKSYPGEHDWLQALQYFGAALQLTAGWGAAGIALIGLLAALWKRLWWPLLLLALSPFFYVWSMHSSGNPIYIPTLWPHSYYNTRYGLAALPLLAICAGAAVSAFPVRRRWFAALTVILISGIPWLAQPRPDAWVCWKESQVNSEARRAWTHAAARFLAGHYQAGTGIFSTLGDLAGAFREAGIPFREVLQEGNEPEWQFAISFPSMFLHEEWAVSMAKDSVSRAVASPRYRRLETIIAKDAPEIRIDKRN